MKAAVYFGPRDIRCTTVDDPVLRAPHEILVKVLCTSICGSDLHMYRGALDAIMDRERSRTGHEVYGEVVEVGGAVTNFRAGDRVTMAYSVSCGNCEYCRLGQTAHCQITNKAVYGFGKAFGDMNGTHAEAMVIPHAEAHVLKLPAGIDECTAITLSCNLPTAVIANRLAAIEPGNSLAVFGCGPTGLMILDLALRRSPTPVIAIDPVPARRAEAKKRGVTVLDPGEAGWRERALEISHGNGFDKVLEVVGLKESLRDALALARPGGTVAALGVYVDQEFDLNLADVTLRDLNLLLQGFANVQPHMRDALHLVERGVLDPSAYFTHEFPLTKIDQAFEAFYEKQDSGLKVRVRP